MQSQDFTYQQGDNGESILAAVHWSPESSYRAEETKPIVLVLHGGGYIVGSKESTPKSQIAYLTSLNFVVVVPNYRLCPQVSARDGAFADTLSVCAWARHKLPALLETSHGVNADGSRLVAMGYSALASFYPSLYVSDADSTAHKPYAAFADKPSYDPTPENEDALWNRRRSGEQISEFPLAPPGTRPLPPRNVWMFDSLKKGTWMSLIQPDGDYRAIDPTVQIPGKDARWWPPTMFVQGDADDAPGCGLAGVARAVGELKKAGARRVELEVVEGAPHMFDMLPGNEVGGSGKGASSVKKALDFLRAEV